MALRFITPIDFQPIHVKRSSVELAKYVKLTEQAHHAFAFQNALNSRIQDEWFAQTET